jgi:hypothetical protein
MADQTEPEPFGLRLSRESDQRVRDVAAQRRDQLPDRTAADQRRAQQETKTP